LWGKEMEMSDRELLESAAKAAGMTRPVDDNGVWSAWVGSPEAGHWWNPLEDDGDALRLAIKLGICIQFIPECDTVQVYQERSETGEPFNIHVGALGDIETRRVIVQAAAEIGKSMQEQAK
jgi:hypothetical protein